MELIEVEVYSYEDPTVMLDVLNARMKPSSMEELKGPGGGDVTVSITDPKILDDPTLLEYRNVFKVRVNGTVVGAFVLGKKKSVLIDDNQSGELYEISGEQAGRSWFNDATVHPFGGLKKNSKEERAFSFASERGDWYDEDDWVAPYSVVKWGDVAGSPWRYAPADWPDAPNAKWVWSQNSISTAPLGDNYFRYEFTADVDAKYSFFVAGDDQFVIYVDGQEQAASDTDSINWSEVTRIDVDLEAGDHVFAAKVSNTTAGPAGFIAAVYVYGDPLIPTSAQRLTWTGITEAEADAALAAATAAETAAYNVWNPLPPGEAKDAAYNAYRFATAQKNISQSAVDQIDAGASWKVCGYPDPAIGWSPGEIVMTLLEEAETRGVRFPTWLTPTFTQTEDSYGNTWPRDLEWTFAIGDTLTEVIEKLEELSCDVWVDPDSFEMHMAIDRGVDRSDGPDALIFEKGKNLRQAVVDGVAEMKNSLAMQTSDGWVEAEDEDSTAKYGVLEAKLDTGVSEAVSGAVANAVFEQKANPEEGASYEVVPVEGYVPWIDFQVGDWVLAPNDRGELVRRRVVSISVEEDNAGNPFYSVEFDTIFKDNEDKLNKWMAKIGGGSLGGSFANGGNGQYSPIFQPSNPPTGVPVIKIPKQVTGLSGSSVGDWSADGVTPRSTVTLTWNPVTANTDQSPTIPTFYEIWGHRSALSDDFYQSLGLVPDNTVEIGNFIPGDEWEFQVRAMNGADRLGEFSAEFVHTPVGPSAAMDAPSAPILSSNKGTVIVQWDGLLDTGNPPPPQFRYVYIETSPTGADTWTIGSSVIQSADGSSLVAGLTIGDDYDVRLTAVDGSGIQSPPSDLATITVTGIDLGDLDESIAEAIDAAEAAAIAAQSSGNRLSDPSFERTDEAVWPLLTADVTLTTTDPRTGVQALQVDSDTSEYEATRHSYPIPVEGGESWLLGARVRATSGSSAVDGGIELSVAYGDSEVTSTLSSAIAESPVDLDDSAYVEFSGVWTVPADQKFARPRIVSIDDGGSNSYTVDDIYFYRQTPNALIVDGAITAIKISANAVTAVAIEAEAVTAGKIAAGAVVAGTIAADAVTANEIAADSIQANHISAGAVQTSHLSPDVGGELDISANDSVTIIVGQIDTVSGEVSDLGSNLAVMQTYYTFGDDGAVISKPGSPFAVALRNDRIEMLENGNVVSYWTSGQMFVNSFVGEIVNIGNHQIRKSGDGTIVQAL